jgi:hypothetical protein
MLSVSVEYHAEVQFCMIYPSRFGRMIFCEDIRVTFDLNHRRSA